jgi:hypothetical protein
MTNETSVRAEFNPEQFYAAYLKEHPHYPFPVSGALQAAYAAGMARMREMAVQPECSICGKPSPLGDPCLSCSIPMVHRATGRTIPDLTTREHICEWQREVKSKGGERLRQLAMQAKVARTKWLESYGVPISPEFADFAEALGEFIEACEGAAPGAEGE